MIKYPILKENTTIGVTAPSSGVPIELHPLLKLSADSMKAKGFHVIFGETVWTQEKAKSAPAKKRAAELNSMLQNDDIQLIFPPWGGELLIEILQFIDFDAIKEKWILGYSDTSVLLLATTLKTGMATAHGTNLIDLRGEFVDDTTAKWRDVLSTQSGNSILQKSSEKYQKEWLFDQPTPCIFHLSESTSWKSVGNKAVTLQGRLLGGCIDVIRHLVGTPFGNVHKFREQFLNNEPILWFFENCDLTTTDLRRSLLQMKLAGWFENCSGIMFGRSSANTPVNNYTAEDVYNDLSAELQLPILFDIDCGHMPPQLTLINGAFAEVSVEDGKGTIIQTFK